MYTRKAASTTKKVMIVLVLFFDITLKISVQLLFFGVGVFAESESYLARANIKWKYILLQP